MKGRYVAIALICAIAPVQEALAASEPAPDPVPKQAQPDPAPVKSQRAPPVRSQQPAATQPAIQAPAQSVTTQSTPAQQTSSAATTATASPKSHRARAHKAKRPKRRAERHAAAPTPAATKPAATKHPVGAIAAARHVAQLLEFGGPAATSEKQPDRSVDLLAAVALLLLVAAGVSVLRLTARMGELGRPG